MSIYKFTVQTITGEERSLVDYEGKVLLIVNTASKCGLTPQYQGLEELYKIFNPKGFEILGFPCNQFGKQEPGTDAEIQEFCHTNYGVTFPLFHKIDVNGPNAHPLYQYLKGHLNGKPIEAKDIQWNFTKFLIAKNGEVIHRFEPQETPSQLEPVIAEVLEKADLQ